MKSALAALQIQFVAAQSDMACRIEDLESQLHAERQRVSDAGILVDSTEGALARVRRELIESERRGEEKDSVIVALKAELSR